MTELVIKQFQETIREYYRLHGRRLPWRDPEPDGSYDPYKILVSEIMLQQTQVNRVIPKYHLFLKQFSDIQTLAGASLSAVLAAWSGLGYNRRAKHLLDAAKQLLPKANLPWKIEDLTACTGIGPNTAAAIMVYAYNQPVIFVETNIRTVFIHHFFADQTAVSDTEILPLLRLATDRNQPREFYWALMDYGTYLKSSRGNLSQRSARYVKQSPFHGSRRQIRGQVLKLLIQRSLTLSELRQHISDKRLEDVLTELESEQLITVHKSFYLLAG